MDIVKRPSKYPMLAVSYTDTNDPFFEVNVMKSLEFVAKSRTMKTIFERIRDAKPAFRPSTFPRMCNVLITPPIDRSYTSGVNQYGFQGQAGEALYNAWHAEGKNDGLKLKMAAKCQAEALSKKESSYDLAGLNKGNGSVCYMYFSNKEVMTKSGEPLPMHTTLAHELIHCMHYLYGEAMWESRDEEHRTVGLKKFNGELLCENQIRTDLGIDPRKKYFADD